METTRKNLMDIKLRLIYFIVMYNIYYLPLSNIHFKLDIHDGIT
jgi:hypothetical protein